MIGFDRVSRHLAKNLVWGVVLVLGVSASVARGAAEAEQMRAWQTALLEMKAELASLDPNEQALAEDAEKYRHFLEKRRCMEELERRKIAEWLSRQRMEPRPVKSVRNWAHEFKIGHVREH